MQKQLKKKETYADTPKQQQQQTKTKLDDIFVKGNRFDHQNPSTEKKHHPTKRQNEKQIKTW